MKLVIFTLFTGMLLAAAPSYGQGLMALGKPTTDYDQNVPLTVEASVSGGYDSIEYDSMGIDDVESYFIQSGVGLVYGTNDRITAWDIGLYGGAIYYFDDAERGDDLFYDARLAFNISHQVSRRLTIGDNFYITYEIEPDYGIGVSTGRRAGQYLYGYNNASVAYAWTERTTSTTGYTIDGIKYTDDDVTAAFEDRFSHLVSQQISYALSRTTKLTLEYRFRYTDYDDPPTEVGEDGEEVEIINPDYTSHYVLAGIDQAWSERLSASVRAGAEFYQSDRSDETAPYAEGSINYALTRQTAIRFYGQAGFDGSELGLYDSRYAIRTGVVATHQFTERFSGNTGVHYVHSEFDGNDEVDSASEDEINATVGFRYNFWQNLSLDANYSYTTISSDEAYRDYERNRVNVGLNATF